MLRLPESPHIQVFYGSLFIELCKLQPSAMPGVVSLNFTHNYCISLEVNVLSEVISFWLSTNIIKLAIAYRGVVVWNSIPATVIDMKPLLYFGDTVSRSKIKYLWRDQTNPNILPNRAKTCTITCLSSLTKNCNFENKILSTWNTFLRKLTYAPVFHTWEDCTRENSTRRARRAGVWTYISNQKQYTANKQLQSVDFRSDFQRIQDGGSM